jgi:hypothetical protein
MSLLRDGDDIRRGRPCGVFMAAVKAKTTFTCENCQQEIIPLDIDQSNPNAISRTTYYAQHHNARCKARMSPPPPAECSAGREDVVSGELQGGNIEGGSQGQSFGECDTGIDYAYRYDNDEFGCVNEHEPWDPPDETMHDATCDPEECEPMDHTTVENTGDATFEDYFPSSTDRKEPRKRSVEWYKQRLDQPIHAHTNVKLRDWVAKRVFLRVSQNMSRDGFDKSHQAIAELLPKPNIMPTTWHVYAGIMGVEQYHRHVRHVCPCGGHVYEYIPMEEYKEHYNDTCPHPSCTHKRFATSAHGRCVPAMWVFYPGVEHAIREYLFRNPRFMERRGGGRRYEDPSCFFGSPEAKRVNEALQGKLFDPSNGAYVLFIDPYQPYDTKEHSTGAILLRSEELSGDVIGKDEFAVPLMVIPGPRQPPSLKALMALIAKDFHTLLEEGFLVEPTKFGPSGEALLGEPFRHHPVLVGLHADSPAAKAALEALKSCQAYMSCWFCKGSGERVGSVSRSIAILLS